MDSKAERRTVYIVRHGATAWNEKGRIVGHTDLSLSDKGVVQAEGARKLLASSRLDLALTSPLSRTRETAAIVLADHGIVAEPEERLVELALVGWEGKDRKELRDDPAWRTWITAPHTISTPEGERLEDVRERAAAALTDALARLPDGGGVVLFTHGGVARVLTLHLLGMPLSGYQKLRCDCASVTAIEVTAHRPIRHQRHSRPHRAHFRAAKAPTASLTRTAPPVRAAGPQTPTRSSRTLTLATAGAPPGAPTRPPARLIPSHNDGLGDGAVCPKLPQTATPRAPLNQPPDEQHIRPRNGRHQHVLYPTTRALPPPTAPKPHRLQV